MGTLKGFPRLYLITDRRATGGRALVEVVTAALQGIAGSGLPPAEVAVQLREKDLPGRALTELAHALRAATAAAGVALYVNDRIDVALAVGADGVHLGGASLDVARAARIAGGLALAVSVHAPAEVAALAAAARDRPAFALLGPIYDTPSKRAFGAPLGPAAITAAARTGVPGVPILAVGGLAPAQVREVLVAGAHGVACIRAVMSADDPAAAVGTFCQELTNFRKMDTPRRGGDT